MSSFSTTHWVIVGLIVFAIYKALSSNKAGKPMYCKACGNNGPTTAKTPGSLWIELVLWLCFIVPGLIYSLWRLSARKQVCASCGSPDLVPPDSPVAIASRKQLGL